MKREKSGHCPEPCKGAALDPQPLKRLAKLLILRQYRTILDAVLRSQIFRQIVQKRRRQANACQGFFVLYDGKDASKTVFKIFIVNCAVLP